MITSRTVQYAPLLIFFFHSHRHHRHLHSFPTRRSSDRAQPRGDLPEMRAVTGVAGEQDPAPFSGIDQESAPECRSEEHTSELQSHSDLVCRLLLEKKKKKSIWH